MNNSSRTPAVTVTEKNSVPTTVSRLATSVPIIFTVAEWGPVNTATLCTGGFTAVKKKFGNLKTYTKGMYASQGYHNEASVINPEAGGSQYIVRLAKLNTALSDVADSVVKSSTLLTAASTLPRGATLLGTVSPATSEGWIIPNDTEVQLKWTVDEDGPSGNGGTEFSATLIGYAACIESGELAETFTPSTPGSQCFFELRVVEGQNPMPVYFDEASYTRAEFIYTINRQVGKASAKLVDNVLKITHDFGGTASYLEVTNASADILSYLGWSVSALPSSGPSGVSNVENTMAVTPTDIASVIEDVSGVTVSFNDDLSPMKFNLVTDATGSNVSITFDSSSDTTIARMVFGIPTTPVYGADAGAASSALKAEAKWYGLRGNKLSVTTSHNPVRASKLSVSDATATDLTDTGIVAGNAYFDVPSLFGFAVGQVLKIQDESGDYVEWVIVDELETIDNDDETQTYRLHITSDNTLTGVFQYTFPQAGTSVQSMEFDFSVYYDGELVEYWPQLSINSAADTYFETVLNDEFAGTYEVTLLPATGAADHLATLFPADIVTPQKLTGGTTELETDDTVLDAHFLGSLEHKTGLYSIHDLRFKASLVAYPGCNAWCMKKIQMYCNQRKDLFFVAAVPKSDTGFTSIATVDAAFNWRDRNGFDSMWTGLYFPHVYVDDEIGVGATPQKEIDPVGHIMGLYARVDAMSPPNGGVHCAPAGDGDYGTLYFVNRLSVVINSIDTEHGRLNGVGINCIIERNGRFQVRGARTLSSIAKWRTIPVRRLFTNFEQTMLLASDVGLFRGNNETWWNIQKALAESMFMEAVAAGAITDYFVLMGIADGTMTQDDIDNYLQKGEFGARPDKMTEFIEWSVTNIEGNSSINES